MLPIFDVRYVHRLNLNPHLHVPYLHTLAMSCTQYEALYKCPVYLALPYFRGGWVLATQR